MEPDDITVFETILRDLAQKLGSLVEGVNLALQVLAARRRTGATAGTLRQSDELVDESRFAVRWGGRECCLGNTVSYRLFRRLAAALNRYVAHDALLTDVWDGERSASAVRSAAAELRRRLAQGGMVDLAEVIDGGSPGHYGLFVDRIVPTHGSDRDPTRIRQRSDRPRASSPPDSALDGGRRSKS